MRGRPATMTVLQPRTVTEALELYAEHPGAVPLAGGTDFMVGWNAGSGNGHHILDLSALESWRAVRVGEKRVRVGALATHWQLQHEPIIRRRFPLLVQACSTVGGRQIQTRGTLGGNLANASPAGDTFPPLAVYDADVVVRSAAGRRRLALLEFFAGVKKTVLADGELVEAVELALPRKPTRQVFRKIGTRAASAISKTVASGLLWLAKDGSVRELRFAFGSMAPTVRRLRAVEAFVAGKKMTKAVVAEAASLLDDDLQPIDDIRSTRFYRLAVSRNVLRAFLTGRDGS